MKINSDIVNKNFSRAASTYDSYAGIQRVTAGRLLLLIKDEYRGIATPGRVFEAGCGTGFLTGGLLEFFPSANFAVTDISGKMLELCKNKYLQLISRKEIASEFKVVDMNGAIDFTTIDLFASSLTFQWIEDQEALMNKICRALSPGGVLVFSTLGKGTFENVRKTFLKLGISYPGPELFSECEIRKNCSAFADCKIHSGTVTQDFSSAKSFFSGLQKIGSVNATGNRISSSDLKKVMKALGVGTLTARYEVLYCVCKK